MSKKTFEISRVARHWQVALKRRRSAERGLRKAEDEVQARACAASLFHAIQDEEACRLHYEQALQIPETGGTSL